MPELIELGYQGAVAIITLNRPRRHNSLVPPLLRQLLDALQQAGSQPDVRALVLQANGRSFSTGGDLAGFYDHLDDLVAYSQELVGLLNETILKLISLPFAVVCALHGQVTGGSLGLVLASDVVLVTPRARITPYYSVVGFSPDGGWTAMLPAFIGAGRAAEILLCNHTISAQQAVEWGIASRMVPAARIRTEALLLAQEIAGMKSESICRTRQLLHPDLATLVARLEAERQEFAKQVASEEARHGLLAFLGQDVA